MNIVYVMENFTEYEYQIYLFLANWSNTNIEYINSLEIGRIRISNIFVTKKLSIHIRISNILYQIFEYSNIWICSCYTAQMECSKFNSSATDGEYKTRLQSKVLGLERIWIWVKDLAF